MATATITLTDLDGEVSVSVNFGGVADPSNSDAHAMALEMVGRAAESGEVTSTSVRRLTDQG